MDSNTAPSSANTRQPGVIEVEPTSVSETAPSTLSRVGAWLRRVFANPPDIWSNQQPSLSAVIEYSRAGEWIAQTSGARRVAHLGYTFLVAVPVSAAAYWLRWIADRPARLAVTTVAAVVVGTGLDQVPGPSWIVPGFLDVTTWF